MRTRIVVSLIVLTLSLAGCSLLPGSTKTFSAAFPAVEGTGALDVTVQDATGLMTGLVIDPEIQPPPVGEGVSDHPDGLVVTWVGGACDASVDFVFEPDGQGYALTGTTITTDQVCILIGIERRIQLLLRSAVPAASVTVTMGDRAL